MNNDQVKAIIQGIGLITEMWYITFNNFKKLGMSLEEATEQTKALVSIMLLENIMENNETNNNKS